ncbi:hypothetical protein [Anaeromicropila herbilytica]|uniref:Uncharacterized protein n=1 Tax=Anaeromicropila herbilytica TaxID=2785025 RepID=A0A7R7ENX3_9FIRM|nr:hypothetical protein [Anaeromicropila herbilytica]BCN32351.1 hypothetical protein bsdtb5_36460 [Anaeromicropila herbilytica]
MLSSSYYSQLIEEEKTKLEKYKKQKEELGTIISIIQSSFQDDIDDINSNVNNCADNAANGIRHNTAASQNIESINEGKEKSIESDNYISSAKSSISAELSNINSKISESLKKLDELGRLRDSALEEERREAEEAERRRQEAEEAAREAAAEKATSKKTKGH